jgi:hypothetical protein
MMHQITRKRFDIIAGYARNPNIAKLAREIGWFEVDSPHLVGIVVIDTDGEFSGIVLAPDFSGRFRWVDQTHFLPTRAHAESELEQHLASVGRDYDRIRKQGDEPAPMDFFTPLGPAERLNTTFSVLATSPSYSAAHKVIDLMMRWYRDQDGNFVEQFQTTGFDARVWELYLFATLVEAGYVVEQPDPAPDFKAIGLDGTFLLEATTINPSQNGVETPRPTLESTKSEVDAYLQHYLPIRYAGPLTAKLRKRYWEHPDAKGLPLAFAIQDFHNEFAMTYSGTALSVYLYGKVVDDVPGSSDALKVTTIAQHRWGNKKVDSAFFYQPEAENVAAVLFNAGGTLPKFNRIGVATGFGSKDVILTHQGVRYEGEPLKRTRFSTEVAEGYAESWIDGMNVYHNPNAIHPLHPALLPGAAHHRWTDGRFESMIPTPHLVSSRTVTITRRS